MKKSILSFSFLVLFSSSAYAFHAVTEILPSGKVLVCKDHGQVKKGNIVEVHARTSPSSRSDKSTAKVREFKLPEIGQKIKLIHRDFHAKGRKSLAHNEEIGTAVVSDESLEGEERISHSLEKSKYSKRVESVSKISKEEAQKIQNECFVAIMDNNVALKEKAAVSWE